MPTLEERVAYLEGKTEEHSRGFGELRDLVIHLDHKVNRFREELPNRIDRVHTRINALDAKFSRYFLLTIGIQITVLLAVIGGIVGEIAFSYQRSALT